MAAEEHGCPVPTDDQARTVLTRAERAEGIRATGAQQRRRLLAELLLGPRIRKAMAETVDAFKRLEETMKTSGTDVAGFIEKVKALGIEESRERKEPD